MKKFNKFQKLTIISFIVLGMLILAFVVLNSFVHTRVTSVIIKGDQNNASIRNQQIRIEFNRPINKQSATEFVSITPEIPFRNLWSGNTLVIIPDLNLDSSTEYTITLSQNLKDIYNETLTEDFAYTFKTEIPKFAMLEKPYDSRTNTVAIYSADLKNREVIIERENIKFYGINENFAVVVTDQNFASNIEILNRKTLETKSLDLKNTIVSSFSFSNSNTRNEFAYTKQEIELKANYYIPKSKSKIFIYSLDTFLEKEFNPQGTAEDVTSLQYSNMGNTLLYKTGDSFFSIAETQNTEMYTGIGRFLAAGNFNKNDTSIVFVAFDPLLTYSSSQFLSVFNSDRVTTKIEFNNIPVLDPQFKNKDDSIIYSERHLELETTKGIYKIMETDINGNKNEILSSTDYSLELPVLSSDDRYIAIEQYTRLQLKNYQNSRSLGFQNKPYSGSIIIFDTKLKKLYNDYVIGSDVHWL